MEEEGRFKRVLCTPASRSRQGLSGDQRFTNINKTKEHEKNTRPRLEKDKMVLLDKKNIKKKKEREKNIRQGLDKGTMALLDSSKATKIEGKFKEHDLLIWRRQNNTRKTFGLG